MEEKDEYEVKNGVDQMEKCESFHAKSVRKE